MAIQVKSQYYFSFDLPDAKDFLSEDLFDSFRMVEMVGNILPQYVLRFKTTDPDIIDQLQEGNVFTVRFGKSAKDSVIGEFAMQKVERGRFGREQWSFSITGMSISLPYLNDAGTAVIEPCSGFEAMKKVAERHFKTDIQPEMSDDKQAWVQPGISDRNFVHEIWLHSKLRDSCPVLGITSDNQFLVRSLKALAEQEASWSFGLQGGAQIPILGNYGVSQSSGFTNAWFGYGRLRNCYDLDTGRDSLKASRGNSMVANGQLLGVEMCGPRTDSPGFLSSNTDPDYQQTYMDNMQNLILHGTVKVRVMFKGVFEPVKVLDPALFLDPSSKTGLTIKPTSGKYIISRVVRVVSVREFRTLVEMVRETFS